jgi:hypothetical protein
LLFLDREDGGFLHLDVPHDANAAGPIAELDVVAPDSTPVAATYALVAWPPSRKASFTQRTLDILRLVEMLGGVNPGPGK